MTDSINARPQGRDVAVCPSWAAGLNSLDDGITGVGAENGPPFNAIRISGHTVGVCRRRLQDRAHQSPRFQAVLERLAATRAD